MKNICTVILFLGLISCGHDNRKNIEANSESFTIVCTDAYVLKLKNNDILKISENTFACNQVDSFDLIVKYMKDKKDIILSGIQTISQNGELLESAGMMQLNYPSAVQINPDNPVEYNISSAYAFPKMELFTYNESSNTWSSTNENIKSTGDEIIKRGKESYLTYCSECHTTDLSADGTGPALGRVEKFRNLDWLIDFTINSQAMIAQGDSLANCLWMKWRPSIMPAFMQLDTSEIEAIYSYLANEAEVQKVKLDSSKFDFSCPIQWEVGSGNYNLVINEPNKESEYYYIARIYSNAWYNVDYFLNLGSEIENPEIIVSNSKNKLHAVIACSNYNAIIQLYEEDGIYRMARSAGKDKIKWPKNEKIYLIIYELNDEGKIISGKVENHIFIEKNNVIKVDLEKMSRDELNEKLEILGVID